MCILDPYYDNLTSARFIYCYSKQLKICLICRKLLVENMSLLLRQIARLPAKNVWMRNTILINQQYRSFGSPAPIQGGDKPKLIELQANDSVWWCSCGYSKDQPFCDGGHERNETGMEPIEFIAQETKKYAFCTCKLSKKAPLCDGMNAAF